MANYTVAVNLQVNASGATSAVSQLNQQLQNLANSSAQSGSGIPAQTSMWENYRTAINNVQTAVGGVQMAFDMLGQGLEVVDMGENVHAVRLAFEALNGGATEATSTLNIYREATRGVVTDMTLMSAANRMQSMGLGETGEQIGELLHMAQALGSVMSPNATTAQNIDNFTLLLANQSVRRLDSFGIGVDAVRQRIEELKDAGYSAQEAFNLAVLEQGRVALENLGTAADAGATNVDRLSTRLQNLFNTVAEGAADIVNQAAGTVEAIIGIAETSSQLAEMQADAMLPDSLVLYRQYLDEIQVGLEAGDTDYASYNAQRAAEEAERYRDAVATAYGLVESNAGAWVQIAANAQNAGASVIEIETSIKDGKDALDMMLEGFRQGSVTAGEMAEIVKDTKDAVNGAADGFERGSVAAGEMAEIVKDTKDALNGMVNDFERGAVSANNWVETMKEGKDALNGMVSDFQQGSMSAGAFDAELANLNGFLSSVEFSVIPVSQITGLLAQGADSATAISAALSTAMGQFDITSLGGGFIGDQQLFRPEEVTAAQDMATYYADLLADAMLLHEQGLITDAELANVQSTADATAILADNAERGAAAFENMTLAQGLGVSGGGMLGEIGGDVSAYMAAGGATDYEQQMYTQQVQLASGQTTQAQMTYDSTIVPMIAGIAAQYGAEAAVQATQNLQSGIAGAQYMGYTDAQIAGGMAGMTGYEAINVSQAAGQSYQNLGSGYATETSYEAVEGFSPDTYLQTMTEIDTTTASIATNSETMASKMAEAAGSAETMSDRLSASQRSLASMNGRTYNVRVKIDADMPQWLEELTKMNLDNGGEAPGAGNGLHPGGGGP